MDRTDGLQCPVSLEPDPFVVEADPDQLRQVVANLLSNALYAIDGEGEIRVDAKRSRTYDTIWVEDTGPGIAPEHVAQLFEPLFTTKAKGTGLGLTICREIIERHGGTIDPVRKTGRGAAFRIRLARPTSRTPERSEQKS